MVLALTSAWSSQIEKTGLGTVELITGISFFNFSISFIYLKGRLIEGGKRRSREKRKREREKKEEEEEKENSLIH